MSFFRYCVTGGVLMVINLVLMYALVDLMKVHYLFATAISITTVFFVRYFFMKKYVFEKTNGAETK